MEKGSDELQDLFKNITLIDGTIKGQVWGVQRVKLYRPKRTKSPETKEDQK